MQVCGVNVTHLPPRIWGVWKDGESGLEEKGEGAGQTAEEGRERGNPKGRRSAWQGDGWAKSLSEGGNRPGLKVGLKGMDGGREGGKGRRKEVDGAS